MVSAAISCPVWQPFSASSRVHPPRVAAHPDPQRQGHPMTERPGPPPPAVRLFFAAFLLLFLELVLIRYLAGTVWNLGYFPNFVLMGVFIGMGLGFVGHHVVADRHTPLLLQGAAVLLALLILGLSLVHPVVPGFAAWQGLIGDEVYFTAGPSASSPWNAVLFPGLFVGVMLLF